MKEAKFQRREAEDKVARHIEALGDELGVPHGTGGQVIAAETLEQCGYEVSVESGSKN